MTPDVALHVNGQVYSGWKTARIVRSIEAICGSFSLSVSERWANQNTPWPINDGDACSVTIGNETVITGFVDVRKPAYSANEHRLEISGRDKTCDLVDCSAVLTQWEFAGISVLDFAKKLCAPFGITVSLQAGLVLPPSPKKLSISPGDSVFDVLEQACRVAGVLPISNGSGGLVLARAGAVRSSTSLEEGQNIKEASGEFNSAGRFAKYIVLGQHAAEDSFFGPQAAQIKASASDPNVTRSARVLIVRPEGNVTAASAQKRAEWEATTRAARSGAVAVTVQGWTQANGDLWPVNALVPVKSPELRIKGDMLISEVAFEVGDSGTLSHLSLKRPDAFKPLPQVTNDGLWKEISRGV